MAFTPIYNTARYALRKDNKSGFRGVAYDPKRKKYRAYAKHEGRQIDLGYFDDPLDAGEAALNFRLQHYPPPDPEPLCQMCGESPARGRIHCNRCTAREYRVRRAAREGKTLGPYVRRASPKRSR